MDDKEQSAKKSGQGRGWHGNSEGHARAGHLGGQKSSGNFKHNPKRASEAGRIGGRVSPGNFKHNPDRAVEAGRVGGSRSGNAVPLQHGEIILLPVDKVPSGKTTEHKNFIVAHSETGHHHVLESTGVLEVTEAEREQLYIKVFGPTQLVHKKTTDFHPTLDVAEGIYKLFTKTEYDLLQGIVRDVKD